MTLLNWLKRRFGRENSGEEKGDSSRLLPATVLMSPGSISASPVPSSNASSPMTPGSASKIGAKPAQDQSKPAPTSPVTSIATKSIQEPSPAYIAQSTGATLQTSSGGTPDLSSSAVPSPLPPSSKVQTVSATSSTPQASVVITPPPVPTPAKSTQTKQELKPATQPAGPIKAQKEEGEVDKKKAQELAMEKQFPFLKRTKIKYPFTGSPIPPTWKVLERYPVNSPFAYAVVAESPLLSKRYFLDEVPLTKTEAAIYSYLLDALEAELTVPRDQVNPRQYFADQARKILLKYSIRVPAASWSKIIYFAERDLVGFGVLDGLMRDPQIEDISIDSVGKPVFLYHKGHESLETNVTINDEDIQDNIITRL